MIFARLVLAIFFIAAGVGHFISPQPFVAIVPPFLPWPTTLVYISGAAEIAGGLGVLFSATRKAAAFCLIGLLTAVFPANIFAAIHGMAVAGAQVPGWLLWMRLPLQPVLIAWVYFACWKEPKPSR